MMASQNFTVGQLITRALRILGVLPSGGGPTADQFSRGVDALNLMVTGWETDGINLWRLTQVSVTVPAGGGAIGSPVTLGAQILQLAEARWQISPAPNLYERPLRVSTYADYMVLPNKLAGSSSGPSVVMFDKQAGASNLYLWPVPVGGGTLNATVARSINAVADSGDTVDVPPEWLETVLYNLADRMMDDDGVAAADPQTAARISARAGQLYQKALNFDRPASIFIRPWGKRTSFRRG